MCYEYVGLPHVEAGAPGHEKIPKHQSTRGTTRFVVQMRSLSDIICFGSTN
jgi:hypothetical protein